MGLREGRKEYRQTVRDTLWDREKEERKTRKTDRLSEIYYGIERRKKGRQTDCQRYIMG